MRSKISGYDLAARGLDEKPEEALALTPSNPFSIYRLSRISTKLTNFHKTLDINATNVESQN